MPEGTTGKPAKVVVGADELKGLVAGIFAARGSSADRGRRSGGGACLG